MPVTYIPSAQNQTPDQIDPRGLMQIALAVHQQKQADAQQKRSNAIDLIKTAADNPDFAMMIDHKKLEGAFKDAGMDLASADQVSAMQKMITGGGPAPVVPQAPVAAPVPPNQLEQLGATMQGNKAGAQSATPPSPGAAAKAPGGGVTPGGIVTPGTGQLQQLQEGAMSGFTKQVGALAPLYMGAASQKQQQYLIAQKQQEIHKLYEEANGGGPGAVRAFGMLQQMNGKTTTADEMRAILSGSNDPTVAKQAMDYALGNETGTDLAKRQSSTLTTILGNKEFMQKLKDPTDAPRIAQSIVDGHGIPSDVMKRPMTLDEIKDTNTYQKQLIDQGFAPEDARRAAEANAQGIPYTLSLPTAMHGLTIPQQEAGAKTTTAQGMLLRGEGAVMEGKAAEDRVALEHDKITKSLDEQLKIKLENDLALQKAGVKLPQELLDEDLSKVAAQSGISVERVYHWYSWMSGSLEAKGIASKGALAGQGPGEKPPAATPRLSHGGRGVTPDEVGRIRSMRGSMQP